MPNYVYSGFHVEGDKKEIERFKQTMFKTTTSDGSNYIDGLDRQETILDFGAVLESDSKLSRVISCSCDTACEELD